MSGSVGVSGAWKDVAEIKTGVGGSWKTVTDAWVGVGGVWKQWYSSVFGGGIVTTWRGSLTNPANIAINSTTGDTFYSQPGSSTIHRIDAGGTTYTYANSPATEVGSMCIHTDGHLYFIAGNTRVNRLNTSTWAVTNIAGRTTVGSAIDGSSTTARFNLLSGKDIISHTDGFLYVADGGNNMIRKVSTAGAVTSPITTNVTANKSIKFNAAGNLVWCNSTNQIYVRDAGTGTSTLLAGATTNGDTDGTGSAARFRFINQMVIEPTSGDIFLTETNGNRVRRVTPGGVVTLYAGDAAAASGFTNATGSAARFYFNGSYQSPGLQLAGGYLFVGDPGNSAIRRIE